MLRSRAVALKQSYEYLCPESMKAEWKLYS